MSTVVPISGDVVVRGEPSAVVVDMLRDLLGQAERGEIVGAAFCVVDPAGEVTNNWAYDGRATGLIIIGGVARLLYRLNKGQD